VIGSFVLGAIMGGAAMWFYGREIRDYVGTATRDARTKAADTLHSAAEGLQAAKERAESAAQTIRSETERRVG
jgi:hypothetical protein